MTFTFGLRDALWLLVGIALSQQLPTIAARLADLAVPATRAVAGG